MAPKISSQHPLGGGTPRGGGVAGHGAAALLAAARERKTQIDTAQRELLELALEWALAHPGSETTSAPRFGDEDLTYQEAELMLAGEGTPPVAEFCIAEFGAVLGMTTQRARREIGAALETAYRLPGIWARFQAGEIQPWRVVRIAQETIGLTPTVAERVDAELAPIADGVGLPTIRKRIEATRMMVEAEGVDPTELPPVEDEHPPNPFGIGIAHDQVGCHGEVDLYGRIHLGDAADLDKALKQAASTLDPEIPYAQRKADALGVLARHYLAHVREGVVSTDARPGARCSTDAAVTGTELVVHVQATGDDQAPFGPVTRVMTPGTGTGVPVHLDAIREWLARDHVKINVRPVIDTGTQIHANRYEIPIALERQVEERDVTCVFPYCQRTATSCDKDHITEWCNCGPTASHNLGPLCRHHHRCKTFTNWDYVRHQDDTHTWTTPHGYRFHVTPHGTVMLE